MEPCDDLPNCNRRLLIQMATAGELLDRLESRHDELIRKLDDLNAAIESTLAQFAKARSDSAGAGSGGGRRFGRARGFSACGVGGGIDCRSCHEFFGVVARRRAKPQAAIGRCRKLLLFRRRHVTPSKGTANFWGGGGRRDKETRRGGDKETWERVVRRRRGWAQMLG